MADTQIATGHAVTAEQFRDSVFQEFLDRLLLAPFMGMDPMSAIQVSEDLTKKPGDAVTFNLASALDGSGVQGENTLEGNEEAMEFFGQRVVIDEFANAVRSAGNLTVQRTPFGLLEQFKPALAEWLAQYVEQRMFNKMADIAGVAYGSATEAQKNAWSVSNSDRVLFGAATANYSGVHATDLANVDSTTDLLNVAHISLLKRLAQLADPKIRPIRVKGEQDWFLLFAHPYAIRDLRNSDPWTQAQREAMPRGANNPLFTGAIGSWDGVIVHEAPKALLLSGVGNGSIDVSAGFLVGAQALLYAQGAYDGRDRVKVVEKDFDYGRQQGAAIMSLFEVEKAYFNSKDHGIVRGYTAAVSD